MEYDPEKVQYFLNDKNYLDEYGEADENQLNMDKIQGSKAVIYSRGPVPYLFCPEQKQAPILPSMYLLFHFSPTSESPSQLLPLRIFLKQGVQ